MERQAHRLRRIAWASTDPAHNPPAPGRAHAPHRVSALTLCSSTQWDPRGPTDVRSPSFPSSDRGRREVPSPDFCVALVLPLTTDKAVSHRGGTNALESQFRAPVL